jgi:hypothetical protein
MERVQGSRLAHKRRLEEMQHSIDPRQIEPIGIECTAHPLKHFGVFAMSGILNRLQKIGIAPHAAKIFRRTGALPVQTEWVARTLFGRQNLLDDDVVFPTISSRFSKIPRWFR